MKRSEYLWRFVASFICAGSLAIGNLFCLITAFDVPVNAREVVILCLLAAFVCSLAFSFKKSWIGTSVFWLLVIFLCVWKWELVKNGFLITVKIILQKFIESYQSLYGYEAVVDVPFDAKATYFMAVLGAVLVFLTAGTVSRRSRLWPLAALSVLLLVPCMLIIKYMPDAWAFMLLLGTYVMLVLTQSQRLYGMGGRYGLMMCLVLPVLILILGVSSSVSPTEHQRPEWADKIRTDFRATFNRDSMVQQNPMTGEMEYISPFIKDTLGELSWNNNVTKTDLERIGPQFQMGLPVMSVWSDDGGTIYLKGNSLGVYEDNSWTAIDEADYAGTNINNGFWITNYAARHEIMVRTNSRSSIFYLPYMPNMLPGGAEIHYDDYVSNIDGVTEYVLAFVEDSYSAELSDEYEAFVHAAYTQVPEETRTALADVLAELSEYGGDIHGIANYVKNSAVYSLETERMPNGEEFVSWFLEDSDTGYCVHFATAATVLLRCMDIPARFVNGYVVHAEAGEWVTVTQDDAHAWVEFYIDGVGWQMLEVTPASSDDEEEQQTEQEELPQQNEVHVEPPQKVTESKEFKGIPVIVWVVIGVVAVLVLWIPCVRKARAIILKKGTYNQRTVKYYHHIRFLSQTAKEPISELIQELALKARFSQHDISDEEFEQVTGEYEELRNRLLTNREPLRYVLYHFVFAL